MKSDKTKQTETAISARVMSPRSPAVPETPICDSLCGGYERVVGEFVRCITDARKARGWSCAELDSKCRISACGTDNGLVTSGLPLHGAGKLESEPSLLNSRLFSIIAVPLGLKVDKLLRERILVQRLEDMDPNRLKHISVHDILSDFARVVGLKRNGEDISVELLLQPGWVQFLECRLVFSVLHEIDRIYTQKHGAFRGLGETGSPEYDRRFRYFVRLVESHPGRGLRVSPRPAGVSEVDRLATAHP